MFRPTITDMQDKYCGDRYDIYRVQSRYKGNHKSGGAGVSFELALNAASIVAATTILVLHVGNGRSEHV